MNRWPTFCPYCGESLGSEHRDGRLRPVCSHCGRVAYLNPAPSVAAILFREGRVLLVKRNVEPGLGRWCLPGGFVELEETLEAAVTREVLEETGLTCKPLRIVHAASVLGGFYGDLLVICYCAQYCEGELSAGEDASDAAWYAPDNLPPLAFDIHLRFLEMYLADNATP